MDDFKNLGIDKRDLKDDMTYYTFNKKFFLEKEIAHKHFREEKRKLKDPRQAENMKIEEYSIIEE